MKRVVSSIAAVALLGVFVPVVQATDSRSQSLLYNLGFEDQTDVFMFPQLLPYHEGVYFHLPASMSNVYGGAILGLGDGALGVFIRRPVDSAFDQYRMPVTETSVLGGNPSNATESHRTGQIFDLMYGARSWGVNLRLFLFSDVSTQYGPLSDPLPATADFVTELNAGFRLSPGFDMRANLAIIHHEDIGNDIVLRAGMRYLDPTEKRLRTVVASELQLGFSLPEEGDATFGLAIPFKAGVLLAAIPEVLHFSLLAGIDIQLLSIPDQDMRFGLGFPVLELAAEWQARKWLQVRTAIKGGWGIQFAGPEDNNPKFEQMVFSSGLGIPLGPFSLDGVIQYSLWHHGPYLVGGAPGLFTGVTLAYRWGEGAASAGSDSWAESAAPKPVIKPKPAAPAEEKPAAATPAEEEKPKPKDSSFEGWDTD